MAVAVQPSTPSTKPPEPMGLAVSSVLGAAVVVTIAALVLRGVPWAWESLATSAGITDALVRLAVQVTAQLVAAILLILAGSWLGSGHHQTPGLRGGIFFMISVAFTAFFCGRALLLISQRGFSFGNIVLMLLNVVVLFMVVQFFRTGRFTQWSLALDKGGWFDTHTHKRTQGLRVRRLTVLGILLVCGTGIWTLMTHNYLPQNATVRVPSLDDEGNQVFEERSNRLGDWVVMGDLREPRKVDDKAPAAVKELNQLENRARPRIDNGVTLLPDLAFTIPLILIGATLWLAWRVVNYPPFADFLIATEAEINKVSWTSRKALIRDTIVVLTSLFLLTVFLFVVDVFWGWLLSKEFVNVLPTAEQRAEAQEGNRNPEPVKEW